MKRPAKSVLRRSERSGNNKKLLNCLFFNTIVQNPGARPVRHLLSAVAAAVRPHRLLVAGGPPRRAPDPAPAPALALALVAAAAATAKADRVLALPLQPKKKQQQQQQNEPAAVRLKKNMYLVPVGGRKGNKLFLSHALAVCSVSLPSLLRLCHSERVRELLPLCLCLCLCVCACVCVWSCYLVSLFPIISVHPTVPPTVHPTVHPTPPTITSRAPLVPSSAVRFFLPWSCTPSTPSNAPLAFIQHR